MKPQATKFKAIKPKMSTKVHNKSTRIKNMETTFHEQECVRERERTKKMYIKLQQADIKTITYNLDSNMTYPIEHHASL